MERCLIYRYTLDDAIRRPDIVVVSGDIILGVQPNSPDASEALASQYHEGLDFLGHLADRLVGGKQERVVMVPTNHDVSADHVARSLRKVALPPDARKTSPRGFSPRNQALGGLGLILNYSRWWTLAFIPNALDRSPRSMRSFTAGAEPSAQTAKTARRCRRGVRRLRR
jgi:hypothetical protein